MIDCLDSWGKTIEQDNPNKVSIAIQVEDTNIFKFMNKLKSLGIKHTYTQGIYWVCIKKEELVELCKVNDIHFSYRSTYVYGENM